MTEQGIEEAISGHVARNAALRQMFLEKGIDLGHPRLVECHFWTWSRESADGLGESLKRRGFAILVQRPAALADDPSRWNLEAGVEQSIELTMRCEFTDELVRLADSFQGCYDGWGTSI